MGKSKGKKQGVVEVNCSSKNEYQDIITILNTNPVRILANRVLAQSIIDRASDFYMRRTGKEARMAYKIDGKRYGMESPPSNVYGLMVSEILSLLGEEYPTATRIRVPGSDGNLEADVSLASMSESSLHLTFCYD